MAQVHNKSETCNLSLPPSVSSSYVSWPPSMPGGLDLPPSVRTEHHSQDDNYQNDDGSCDASGMMDASAEVSWLSLPPDVESTEIGDLPDPQQEFIVKLLEELNVLSQKHNGATRYLKAVLRPWTTRRTLACTFETSLKRPLILCIIMMQTFLWFLKRTWLRPSHSLFMWPVWGFWLNKVPNLLAAMKPQKSCWK